MDKLIIKKLQKFFEEYVPKEKGAKYWFARDLQILLYYNMWVNFKLVIDKAKDACKNAKQNISDYFPKVRKMISLGKGGIREIEDYMFTKYACYLIAQNGSSRT